MPETRPRLLLVDDEERLVLNMARILEQRGYEVRVAFNGLEAVEAIKSGDVFDVVVMDVKMPFMDGIEALRLIRELSPLIEIIMLTGNATLDNGIEALRLGAFDYLLKPCAIEDLIMKIEEAFQVDEMKEKPVLWAGNQVKSIALPASSTMPADRTLKEAVNYYEHGMPENMDTVFIVDADDRLIGILTKGDLIAEVQMAHSDRLVEWSYLLQNSDSLPQKNVSEIMQPDITSVGPDESFSEAGHTMITNNLQLLPVVDEGKIIGSIRLRDIFDYIARQTA
jgi:CheY-like chemotaxis protein